MQIEMNFQNSVLYQNFKIKTRNDLKKTVLGHANPGIESVGSA